MLLAHGCTDLPRRRTDHGRRLVGERVLTVWPACPIDGVLESTGNGAIVLGRHEEHRVDGGDGLLERAARGWVVLVVVVAVERQIGDGNLAQLEGWWRESGERQSELAIDRSAREATDEVTDGKCGHGRTSG